MKHLATIILTLCCAVAFSSCVDREFDLSKVKNEDVTIGNDETEFRMPLLSLRITSDNISQSAEAGEVSIKNLYTNLSVWLPSELPGGVDFIDVPRLMDKGEYFETIFDVLYDEVQLNEQKRSTVCHYLVGKHRARLIGFLLKQQSAGNQIVSGDVNNLSDEELRQVLSGLIVDSPDLIGALLRQVAAVDVDALTLKDISVDIPSLDISQDIEDMLVDNLDSASEIKPKRALYIKIDIDSNFPFEFLLRPVIDGTIIKFGDISIHYGKTEMGEIRIYAEDLHTIFNGSHFSMPISVVKYFPYLSFGDDCEIVVRLSVCKKGGLTI